MRKEFVPAQIQRPNHHRHGFERGSHFAVSLQLLFLAGQVVAIDEKIFGAEESDAFSAVFFDRCGIGRLLDIGREQHSMAIERNGRFALNIPHRVLQRGVLADKLAIFEQRLIGWVENNNPIEPIQQGILPGFQFLLASYIFSFTSPFSVNLKEFDNRFFRIWFRRSKSVSRVAGKASSSSILNFRFLFSEICLNVVSTNVVTSLK